MSALADRLDRLKSEREIRIAHREAGLPLPKLSLSPSPSPGASVAKTPSAFPVQQASRSSNASSLSPKILKAVAKSTLSPKARPISSNERSISPNTGQVYMSANERMQAAKTRSMSPTTRSTGQQLKASAVVQVRSCPLPLYEPARLLMTLPLPISFLLHPF